MRKKQITLCVYECTRTPEKEILAEFIDLLVRSGWKSNSRAKEEFGNFIVSISPPKPVHKRLTKHKENKPLLKRRILKESRNRRQAAKKG